MEVATEIDREELLDRIGGGFLVKIKEKFAGIRAGETVKVNGKSFLVTGLSHGRGRMIIQIRPE